MHSSNLSCPSWRWRLRGSSLGRPRWISSSMNARQPRPGPHGRKEDGAHRNGCSDIGGDHSLHVLHDVLVGRQLAQGQASVVDYAGVESRRVWWRRATGQKRRSKEKARGPEEKQRHQSCLKRKAATLATTLYPYSDALRMSTSANPGDWRPGFPALPC